jgi:hypothetical protein
MFGKCTWYYEDGRVKKDPFGIVGFDELDDLMLWLRVNKNLEIVEFFRSCFEEQGERKSFELKGGCANEKRMR